MISACHYLNPELSQADRNTRQNAIRKLTNKDNNE